MDIDESLADLTEYLSPLGIIERALQPRLEGDIARR